MLQCRKLTCGYGKKITIKDIDLSFEKGEVICLLGSNGVGKTTFFKTLLGFLKSVSGEIFLLGKPISNYSKKNLAKHIAYVPQAHQAPFDFSIKDVVMMGRTIHFKRRVPSSKDWEIVDQVIDELGIEYMKDDSFMSISGGERQMVLIARALAQESDIIIMDEPTSNLDFGNQSKILQVIKKLKEKNKLIIMTTHSPNQAFECGTEVVIFNDKKVLGKGNPDDIITDQLLKQVYDINGKVYELHDSDLKVCVSC